MPALPPDILSQYRAATSTDIRSWSFGALKSIRKQHAQTWQQRSGTLDDQATFGPLRDYECACGKYRGREYESMICDRCGVKITGSVEDRRSRFGHIELPIPVSHPFVPGSDALESFPVIPAAFSESPAGDALAEAYDGVVVARTLPEIDIAIGRVGEILVPIVLEAHHRNLVEALTLVRGLALERRDEQVGRDDRCHTCGYPLSGLTVASCPGCGHPLTS